MGAQSSTISVRDFLARFDHACVGYSVPQVNSYYTSVIEGLVGFLGGCAGCILFLDLDSSEYDRMHQHGYRLIERWWDRIKTGDGLAYQSLSQKELVIARDVSTEDSYVSLCAETSCQMSLPLINSITDKVEAIIVLEFTSPDTLDLVPVGEV